MRRATVIVAWAVVWAGALPSVADAHTRSQSTSRWQLVGDGVVGVFSAPGRLVTALPAVDGLEPTLGLQLSRHLHETVRLWRGEVSCQPVSHPRPLHSPSSSVRVELAFTCPGVAAGGPLALEVRAFLAVKPGHLHFARPGWRPGEVRLFTAEETRHGLPPELSAAPAAPEVWEDVGRYVDLGVVHILAGWDHLAFLCGLLLLCRRLRHVVWVVTGFTVGHSLTLALAATGLVSPQVPLIEALIGFTVALVGVEVLGLRMGSSRGLTVGGPAVVGGVGFASWCTGGALGWVATLGLGAFVVCYGHLVARERDAVRLAPIVTVAFGLIHGFGFADVLLEVGLPPSRWLPTLFGFNLGVELGQLAVVALAGLVVHGARRVFNEGQRRALVEIGAAALVGVGLFWFLSRAMG